MEERRKEERLIKGDKGGGKEEKGREGKEKSEERDRGERATTKREKIKKDMME